MNTCDICKKSFSRPDALKRHSLRCGNETAKRVCLQCDKQFWRADVLKKHVKRVHSVKSEPVTSLSPFTIIDEYVSQNKKFKIARQNVVFKLNEMPKNKDAVDWLKQGVEGIVNHSVADIDPGNKVGFTFSTVDGDKEAHLAFRRGDRITFDDVWGMISKIYQSNSKGLNTDKFRMCLTYIKMPKGSGRRSSNHYSNFEEECRQRKGVVTINNADNLCLPRAVVVAMAKVDKDPKFADVRKDTAKLQLKRAQKLLDEAGVTIPLDGAGVEEVKALQMHLKGSYKITVYEYCTRNVIFEGPEAEKKLNLLYCVNHYNVITSLTSAFGCGYFCDGCKTSYNNKQKHRCQASCPCCQTIPSCKKVCEKETHCLECNRYFRGFSCFQNHLHNGICSKIRKCSDCLKTIKKDREHDCTEIFCKICQSHQPENHKCFIQQDKTKPWTDGILYIFYDLETRQETVRPDGTKLHEPNLCVFQQRCSECLYTDQAICHKCGIRRHVLKVKPIEIFFQHVLNQSKIFKKIIVIAHNGQAFDHQFILKYTLENTKHTPEMIMRGSKIILMQIGKKIKFIDSLNYFPMALSALPKAFDLPPTHKKGYFPHLFNTLENQNYVGPMPNVTYYDPDSMKPEGREEFLKWYEEHKNNQFDFQKEFVDYCISDVEILTEACIRFRRMMLKECNVDPFLEATTIASACNLVFRRNFLQQSTIGIIPRNGYRNGDNQSEIALKWLIWEAQQRNIDIRHAANSREVSVYGMKVDGYCNETNQIFEFNGCYYHGHDCLRASRDQPLHEDLDDTLNTRLQRTKTKTERLRQLGYEVIEMWECNFKKLASENEALRNFSHPLLNCIPLNPRDSFFGGRTGNTVLKYEIKPGEKIKYLDVCSLYPWVCKYGKFPVGHPKLYIGLEECSSLDLTKTDGLIKCKILPPEQLYHPVLPVKMNNKLLFTLCRECATNLDQENECTHDGEERALIGTWVIDEVVEAMNKGYKLIEIYEIWKYEIVQYDGETGGLFAKFINKFLKIKQEASGWPEGCITHEEKEKYVEAYMNQEGIQLEFEKIYKNAGLRALAKLMLNSFWGKFGQRENQSKTSIVRDPKDFFELLSNPAIDVNSVLEINDDVIIVNWEHKDEARDLLSTVNVGIASYTTTQARLKLYTYLDKLGDRILYYDTDSIIFVSQDGEIDPPTGSFLGDLTDELENYGPGSFITTFVSTGPKCYAYSVWSPTRDSFFNTCKVKGITINYETAKKINLDSMLNMVNDTEPIIVASNKILRTKTHEVITKTEPKLYQVTARKRKFMDNSTSVPYGYKKQCVSCT